MGLPSLPCPQVRVYFSPVSLQTHMTSFPKDTRKNCLEKSHGARRGGLAGKALTAQASQAWPVGRGASSNSPSLGFCLIFPHL